MQIRRTMIDDRHKLLSQEAGASRLAVFFPGANYGPDAPLLWYTRKAALLAGCDTLSLDYGDLADTTRPFEEQLALLADEADRTIGRVLQPGHRSLLFVSKSMGTVIAGEVAGRFGSLPVSHLFLTPFALSVPYLVRAKGVVFTGTADPKFGESHLSRIRNVEGLEAVAVPRAGHSLELEDDLGGSLRILSEVSDACTRLASR